MSDEEAAVTTPPAKEGVPPMSDIHTTRDLDAALDGIRAIVEQNRLRSDPVPRETRRLLAVVDALLAEHAIEPLYALAENCSCVVPDDEKDPDAWATYQDDHPIGENCDSEPVCLRTVTGRYCTGCTEWMGRHIDLDGDYVSASDCPVRSTIARVLTGVT